MTEIQSLLRARFSLSDEQVLPDRPLADVGIDSLAAVELMFELEEHFEICLSDQRADVKSVDDLARLVEHVLQVGSTAA